MASIKYIGYVGRLAVAVGVGAAAIAVTGPGTAYAETGSSSPSSTDSSSGSEKTADAGEDKKSTDSDETDSTDSTDSDETGSEKDDTDAEDAKPSLAGKLRQSAEQFEAEQVEKLRAMFTPPAAAAKKEPEPERDSAARDEPVAASEEAEESEETVAEQAANEAAPADEPAASAAAAAPRLPDPFRPDDPDPDDVPATVIALRDAILRAPIDPRIKPVIREGIELAYRISQVAPVANIPVPAYKIIPALAEAARGNKAGAQVIVNQLLLTTQPVALLYYGYDQIADLLNMEYEARDLKEEFYRTAWDTVDPLALLHIRGQHGLRR